jgi:hypothetical protein
MKLKGLLILLCILIIIGTFFYYYEIRGTKIREQEKELKEKLYSFSPDDVSKIELIDPLNKITLIKEKNLWKITQPINTDAEQDTISTFLDNIKNVKIQKELKVNKNKLEEFGLKPGKEIIKLYKHNQLIADLTLGNQTPSYGNIYLYEAIQNKIFLSSSSLEEDLKFDLYKLREKRITNFKSENVKAFTILSNNKEETRCEIQNDSWYVTKPKHVLANNIKISSFLATMEYLKAESFEDKATSLSDFKLDNPDYLVSIVIDDKGTEQKISISAMNNNDIYAAVNGKPPIVKISSNIYENLKKGWTQFRENRPLAYNSFNVIRIILNNKGKIFELVKDTKEDKWTMVKPAKAEADTTKVNQFLWSFDIADANDIIEYTTDLHQYEFDKSNLSLTVYELENEQPIEKTMIVGKHDTENKKVYVLNKQKQAIFVVPDVLITLMNKNAKDFLKTEKPKETEKKN